MNSCIRQVVQWIDSFSIENFEEDKLENDDDENELYQKNEREDQSSSLSGKQNDDLLIRIYWTCSFHRDRNYFLVCLFLSFPHKRSEIFFSFSFSFSHRHIDESKVEFFMFRFLHLKKKWEMRDFIFFRIAQLIMIFRSFRLIFLSIEIDIDIAFSSDKQDDEDGRTIYIESESSLNNQSFPSATTIVRIFQRSSLHEYCSDGIVECFDFQLYPDRSKQES